MVPRRGYSLRRRTVLMSKSAIFEFSVVWGGGGYFGNLTFKTESKSAIFEFGGGGGYFGNLTFNTESKSAIFEFSVGGGYFGK